MMNALDILCFMGDLGIRYPKDAIDECIRYVENMVRTDRVITIRDGSGLNAIVFFSICNDWEPFYKKETWEYYDHTPTGNALYVEKIVAKRFTKEMRRELETLFLAKYPQLEFAKWHRWGKIGDRGVTVRRKLNVY